MQSRVLRKPTRLVHIGVGGWRWTFHSPTGSGPEGSSPNETGRVSVQPPTFSLFLRGLHLRSLHYPGVSPHASECGVQSGGEVLGDQVGAGDEPIVDEEGQST